MVLFLCTHSTFYSAPKPSTSHIGSRYQFYMEYESHIFDSESVHIIDTQVSAADWEGLKKDALSKECIDSTVTIDG